MKTNKLLFNNMLRAYNKYKRKLSNLVASNRNSHRQSVLEKHITRLYERLMNLQASFKQTTIATALVVGAMALQPNEAKAQFTFSASVNPYGLAIAPEQYSKPAFADLDNDGDLDMLSGQYYGDFAYFQNTGTNVSPAFAVATTNPFGLTPTNNNYSSPAFVDLDGDGDMDMMAGDRADIRYYENVGTASAPSFTNSVLSPFGIVAPGQYSFPSFADLDNDGDMDMMVNVGSYSNNGFYYYQNTGTNMAPAFAAPTTVNPFGLTSGYTWGVSLGDLDKDGDFDLISGDGNGNYFYYENTGSASAPAYAPFLTNPFALINTTTLPAVGQGRYNVSTFVDLNNDNKLDIMTGDRSGDFIFNKNVILPGAALIFNGINNFASSAVFNTLTNNITIAASVYWGGPTTGNQMIVCNGNSGSSGYALFVDHSNSDQLSVVLGGVTIMQAFVNLNTGQWNDVAVVCNAGTWSIYLNGNYYNLTNNTSVPNAVAGSFAIGANQSGTENFKGTIDEVKFWGRAVCYGEIDNYAHGNGELPMPQTNLVAYYKFNEGLSFQNNSTVTMLADSSGNAHNLTLQNFALNGSTSNWAAPGVVVSGLIASPYMPNVISVSGNNYIPSGTTTTLTATGGNYSGYTWGASAGSATIAAVAVSPTVTTTYTVQNSSFGCLSNVASYTVFVGNFPGASLDFDGINHDAVLVSTGTNSLAAPFTVEAWIKPTAVGYLNILSTRAPSDNSFDFKYAFSSDLRADIGNGSSWINTNAYGTGPTSINTWMHVAIAVTNTDYVIYKNGQVFGSGALTGGTPLLFDANHQISIGGNYGSENFNGGIDEVRIWSRALCQGELQHNMNAELTLPQSGLVAYYQFNQGMASANNLTVTTVPDLSGSAYTGTLTNFGLTGQTSNWVAPGGVTTGSMATVFNNNVTVIGNTIICAGATTTLTANGITTYTWSSGSNTNMAVVSPTTNATYTVTGSNLGCPPVTSIVTVSVNALPSVTVNSGIICRGKSFTITPSGANTFSYSTGPVVTPTANASYSVTGTNTVTGCVSAAAVSSVTVNALPSVSVTSGAICSGKSFTLTPSGANTYTYSTGPVVTPTASASYSVTGTNTLTGCVSTVAVSSVTVNALPTVSATSSNSITCISQTVTLNATGATSYTWNTMATGASISVSPSVTTVYTVTGTNSNGCINMATVTQSISTCAGVDNSLIITPNSSLVIYPNPTKSILNIELEMINGSNTKIEIVNVLGEVVLTETINNQHSILNIQHLANGLYLVKANGQTVRLIKE